MNSWFAIFLGDGLWADTECEEIRMVFQPQFELKGKPIEMAVFTRREEGRLHCEMVAYFSPAADKVAGAFDAEPCVKPARQGLELLAGNAECWCALFLEGER